MPKLVLNIFLTGLILLQSVGITLSKHYCGEILMKHSIGLWGEELDCCMDMDEMKSEPVWETSQENPFDPFTLSSVCCVNDFEHLQSENDITAPTQASFDLTPLLFILITFGFLHLLKIFGQKVRPYSKPPLSFRKRKLQFLAFLQVFRN
ncbi:HYC_CC_PP family protein [Xanthovirga aplysinae]|uniref:HYC_CC_PP family protein n=1 Tax=Xanthovirga aplysinae TaxID=2529853 RepID=UPI0012BCEC71|nr:hypothetical protein [Xanthovirga aplysinae]MTI32391.1 hypothetical protein [Xanthovirga aplysinae]